MAAKVGAAPVQGSAQALVRVVPAAEQPAKALLVQADRVVVLVAIAPNVPSRAMANDHHHRAMRNARRVTTNRQSQKNDVAAIRLPCNLIFSPRGTKLGSSDRPSRVYASPHRHSPPAFPPILPPD